MKLRIFLYIFILIIPGISKAQIIKGRITDQSGQPIPYATVYISELRQGTTSNAKGDYEIRLPAGKYLIQYQSLGYQQVFFDVTLNNQLIIKDIVLPLQYYQLPEVRVSATGEDPAYAIMRRAVGMAPYYLNHVSYYKSNVYLKGNLVINKFPKILQRSLKAELKKSSSSRRNDHQIKEGDAFLMESVNELEFTAPDKYIQRIISAQSSFPEAAYGISPLDYIEASFYEPVLADMAISPLSPQAFNYYRFRYLGATSQGNFYISKIEVIPKRKSQQLFYGTIFIIEDLWCLHSVDLTNENLAGKIRVQQLYIQIQDDIWMPVSHKFDINISIMGFKADAFYGSSVKYLEVKRNLSLDKTKSGAYNYASADVQVDTTITKGEEQIGKILQKEELSNRDMAKLSRLMKKESENSVPDTVKKDLEIKEKRVRIIEEDVNKKDTAYWSEIRPIPLSEIEFRSLQERDSIRAVLAKDRPHNDSIPQGQDISREKNKFITAVSNIFFGHTWSDTTGFRFTHGGLIGIKNINFNTVDGFIYGTDFRISKMFSYGNTISFYPDLRWTFSREKLMWGVNGNYTFGKKRPQMISVRIGNASRDISNGGSINLLLNSETSLLFRKNYLKLYESSYRGMGYKIELVNGLSLDLNANTDNRKALQNNSTFSFNKSNREYTENIPANEYAIDSINPYNAVTDQRHFEYSASVTYIPFRKYRMVNNRKIPMGSDWPTFSLAWEHGINEFSGINDELRHYDMIRFEASKTHTPGAFSEFRWRVRSGGFLDNRTVPYYDFFHFNSQPVSFLLDNYQDAFMLPPYYSLSTPEFFGEAHIKYTTPYLLIKLLPFLSNTIMRENISLSFLGSLNRKNYTELGYSISEFFFFGEIGVYVGFDDIKFRKAGAKVTFRFN